MQYGTFCFLRYPDNRVNKLHMQYGTMRERLKMAGLFNKLHMQYGTSPYWASIAL